MAGRRATSWGIVGVMADHAAYHEEERLGRAYDARLMRRLLSYVKPYKGLAAVAVALILLSSLLQLVGPLATAVALDLFMEPPGDEGSVSVAARWTEGLLADAGLAFTAAEGVAAMAVVYLASLVLAFGVLYVQSYVMQMMGQRIMYDLRREVFGRFQRLPMAYFDRNPLGRLVTRVTTDVDALNELFTAGLVTIFGDVMLLAGIVGVLFWLNWKLALVTFAILPALLALTLWFKVKARDSYREVRVKIARINAFLQERITGMTTVHLYRREAQDFAAFDEPDYVKIAWTVAVTPRDDGRSVFRTETRAVATDPDARARFRRYWTLVSPGIVLIRWEMLRLVKREAERRTRSR